MDDLVAFLRERTADDQAAAQRMSHYDPDEAGYYACPETRDGPLGDLPGGPGTCDCGQAERQGRALREVGAKRRILDEYERQVQRSDENTRKHTEISRGGWDDRLTNLRTHGWELSGVVLALEFAVRTDAAVYSDHEDYRKEWSCE